ncbi:Dixin [Entomortierella beljakovae]|nr:Dixin [Entomortierella beljakovae]
MTKLLEEEQAIADVKSSPKGLDNGITKSPKQNTNHPHPYLNGNFHPVFEETVGDEGIECEVIGVIPESLRGSQYIRTGPNTVIVPDGKAAHHFFDGDGMLHGVYFHPGVAGEDENTPIRARYMNRYIRTDIYEITKKHGKAVQYSVGLLLNRDRGYLKALRQLATQSLKMMLYGASEIGTGNTALAVINDRFLALNEAGTPIDVELPSLNTVGHYFFEKEGQKHKKRLLPVQDSCTAHPKIDPNTNETVLFAWRVYYPFAVYSVISADGKKKVWQETIPGFNRPTMMHDFAITPTYSIIMKMAFSLEPIKNIRRKKALMSYDETAPARFGIIPRYFNNKKDKVLWFETRPCHIFHTGNAWDEKDAEGNVVAVCMIACRSERFVSDINTWSSTGPDSYCGGKTKEEIEKEYATPGDTNYDSRDPDGTYMTLFRFDLKTMKTRITTLSNFSAEFPVINQSMYMRPEARYTYLATVAPTVLGTGMKIDGVAKVDAMAVLERQQVLLNEGLLKTTEDGGSWEIGSEELSQVLKESSKVYKYGGSRYGGEVSFVPNPPKADGKVLDEDDGYLLVYVYDENELLDDNISHSQMTELWIFNAKKLENGPVATVKIPKRIPYGFHGLHVTKKQIQANKALTR